MTGTDRNKRYALVALALALVAIVLASWLTQPTNAPEARADAGKAEQRQADNVANPVSSHDNFDPWRDTYPQWMMAILSLAATAFSIWAVFLVRDTLGATRDAVAETRRIGEAQVRAYIGSPKVEAWIEGTNESHRFRIKAYITNSGNSPARFPAVNCSVCRGEQVVNAKATALERDIAAGETDFCFLDQGSPLGGIVDFLFRGGQLNFKGEITYSTVFDDVRRVSAFDIILDGYPGDEGRIRARANFRADEHVRIGWHYT